MRWLAPSATAASCAALVVGASEGVDLRDPLTTIAAFGFVALLVFPVMFVASLVVRCLARGWQLGDLAATAIEESGGAPWLVGWIAAIGLGLAAIGSAVYIAAARTGQRPDFGPMIMSLVGPAVAVVTALVVVIASRPVAAGLAVLARITDRAWTRRGHSSLLRPRVVFGGIAIVVVAAVVTIAIVVLDRIGPFDLGLFHGPIAGLVTVVAVHVAWGRFERGRTAVAVASVVAVIAVMSAAIVCRFARPAILLEVWGDRPLAGATIENAFSLDNIRNELPAEEFRPVPRAGAPHPDIILITIDTVRADHTPPYGGKAAMPTLAAMSELGVTFDRAFSPSNVTRRSIPSMIVGLAPTRVRGRVVGWALRLDPRYLMLAERLRAAGYDTAGFMCCTGFWDPTVRTGMQRGLDHLEIEPNGARLSTMAATWLRERKATTPLFMWMHILEPHNWVAITGEPHGDAQRTEFYDRVLAQCDSMLATVMAAFASRPEASRPIVIITADHGEALGEHGHAYHSTDLYDSQTHVPLVISGPGLKPGRIRETVSLIGLMPSIVELAGFEPPSGPSVDGRSFADLATGARASDDNGGTAFAAMIRDRSNPGGVVMVVSGHWKLIRTNGEDELYDIEADPDEKHDLAASRPDELTRLRALLADRLAEADASPFSAP